MKKKTNKKTTKVNKCECTCACKSVVGKIRAFIDTAISKIKSVL